MRGQMKKRIWSRRKVEQKPPSLVLQRNHRLIATAESGYTQQAALPVGHGHHWTVAIYGVPSLSKIPFAPLVLTSLLVRD